MLAALCAMRSVGFPRPAPSLSRCKGRVLDLEARVKNKAPKVFTNGAINAGIDTCHAGLASLMKNFTMLPSLSNWLLAVNEIGESAENAAI